ncbi:hypothetical protein LP416_12085 [Polaromonas sp. P2-4]|nr:hypothetical protein LP416_12085 [Polaromonas sp. P2-4]
MDKFVDDARTSGPKPYLARLARVVPQIEAVGILCVNAVVFALSPPRMRDTPERLNELQN